MRATDLQDASYKGVRFAVRTWSGGRGQRREVYDYPGLDKALSQAFGRAHRTWDLEAVITGEDWQARLDALLTVVEDPEAGELVLPDGSRYMAVCDPVDYEVTSVGEAVVRIRFHEVADKPLPEPEPVADALVTDAADAAMAQEATTFADKFQRGRKWLQDATQKLAEMQDALERALSPTELQALLGEVRALDTALWSLAATPTNLVARWRQVLSSVTTLPTARLLADTWRDWAQASAARLAGPVDPVDLVVVQSTAAHDRLVWAAAVERWAQIVAETDWQAYDDAVEALDEIGKHVDELETDNPAWVVVRARLTDGVMVRALRLPRLRQWTVPETMSAREIAWRLYGDAERATEIMTRNDLPHPGFVGGGQVIWVLER